MKKQFTVSEFAKVFDHSILNPFISDADISAFCGECRQYQFACAAVNTAQVRKCAELLSGSGVPVGGAVGYPFGQTTIAVKRFEAESAIQDGAGELDYVLNISEVKNGHYDYIEREMRTIADLCREKQICSKVIIETCYLTDDEKKRVCEVALKARPNFVKTSTGYGSGGATLADIQLLYSILGGSGVKVKASGGVRTLADVMAYINAGAERIGTIASVSIMKEFLAAHPEQA